ncbi:MAG: ATP-binding protein [Planctomycetota bacterium]
MSSASTACRLALAYLLVTGGALSAQAHLLQLPTVERDFSMQHWTTANGLPQNSGADIAPAADGSVWVATLGGLCRLGGDSVEVWDTVNSAGLSSSRIQQLLLAQDGTLWVGTDRHGLVSLRDGRFEPFTALSAIGVSALGEGAQGNVFVGTDDGVYRLAGATCDKLASVGATALRCLRDGRLVVGNADGLFLLGTELRQLSSQPVLCIVECGERVVVGTQSGLMQLDDQRLEPLQPDAHLERPVRALAAAADGTLWVATDSCLVRIDASLLVGRAPIAPDPMAFSEVIRVEQREAIASLAVDVEGAIWVGYRHHGLSRLQAADLLAVDVGHEGLRHGLLGVADDLEGGVYLATERGVLHRRSGGFELVPELQTIGHNCAMSVTTPGQLWCYTTAGLSCRDHGQVRLVVPADRLGVVPRAMCRGADGRLWLAGGGGLGVLGLDESYRPFAPPEFGTPMLRRAVLAPDGAIWVGGPSLLARIDPATESVRIWRCGTDLPLGEIRGILPEEGPNALVASYGSGLLRVRGAAIVEINERNGLFDQSLCAMVAVGEDLLLAANRAAYLVSRAAVDEVFAGRSCTLGSRRLLVPAGYTDECSGGMQGCLARVGEHYWLCGIDGLFEFAPERMKRSGAVPPLALEAAFLGADEVDPSARLRASNRVLSATLRLTMRGFDRREQYRYRWRVLGIDVDWTDPAFGREVHLDGLPAGDLQFEAQAVGPDGAVGPALAVALHVPAAIWETTTFAVLAPLGGAAVLFLLVRWFTCRERSRALELAEQVRRRTVELIEARDSLEQRVASRTSELEAAMQRQEEEAAAREQLERQVQQLRRMESIGQLAGGVAHDFNNLLTVVVGSVDLLREDARSPLAAESCQHIADAAARGRRLTQHLLAVASRQVVVVERLALCQVVNDLLPVLRTLVGEGIELRFRPRARQVFVSAAVTQIEQVMINLVANARDAMPHGGQVELAIEERGRIARLQVVDTGCGMTAEVVDQAFTPFFSTKDASRIGRGLGLATVYGIVKQLGGEVHIDSRPGDGTRVAIELPLAERAPVEEPVQIPRPVPARLTSRVLLVEDQDDVRRVLVRILERLGCSVHPVESGTAAVEWLQEPGRAVDIVVSDVVMPGLQGLDLVAALRERIPDLPIVFLSGYLEGRQVHDELAERGLEVLAKPVDTLQLAAAIAKAVASRDDRTESSPSHG